MHVRTVCTVCMYVCMYVCMLPFKKGSLGRQSLVMQQLYHPSFSPNEYLAFISPLTPSFLIQNSPRSGMAERNYEWGGLR